LSDLCNTSQNCDLGGSCEVFVLFVVEAKPNFNFVASYQSSFKHMYQKKALKLVMQLYWLVQRQEDNDLFPWPRLRFLSFTEDIGLFQTR